MSSPSNDSSVDNNDASSIGHSDVSSVDNNDASSDGSSVDNNDASSDGSSVDNNDYICHNPGTGLNEINAYGDGPYGCMEWMGKCSCGYCKFPVKPHECFTIDCKERIIFPNAVYCTKCLVNLPNL